MKDLIKSNPHINYLHLLYLLLSNSLPQTINTTFVPQEGYDELLKTEQLSVNGQKKCWELLTVIKKKRLLLSSSTSCTHHLQ